FACDAPADRRRRRVGDHPGRPQRGRSVLPRPPRHRGLRPRAFRRYEPLSPGRRAGAVPGTLRLDQLLHPARGAHAARRGAGEPMAATGRRADSALTERLFLEPHRFGFFQAVRLLELFAPRRTAVGNDGPPATEAVRFCAEHSFAFPASEVLDLEAHDDDAPARMIVRHMGLTGPMGTLPRVYTALVLERLRQRDRTLADFLDLFNHRLVSLFYRAWAKYRPHLRVTEDRRDTLSTYLFSFFGLGTHGLRRRIAVDDRALLFYTGLLAQRPRSAVGLCALLGDYFGDVPVRVDQFVGQWLHLDPEGLTSLRPF